METMTRAERRRKIDEEDFMEFSQRKGWERVEMLDRVAADPGVTALRNFRYGGSTSAWLTIFRPVDTRRAWEAGVYVPFGEGPETSHKAGRFQEVRIWAMQMEQILEVPLALEHADSPDRVASLLRRIDRQHGWGVIAAVFDCAVHTAQDVLVRRQAPLIPMQPRG